MSDSNIILAKSHFRNFQDKPFYDYQFDALKQLEKCDKPYVFINAATGSGKSILGAVSCQLSEPSVYLVHSKSLQEQLREDFPEFSILMGRSNYPCLDNQTADYLGCDKCRYLNPKSCEWVKSCGYKLAKQAAQAAHLRVLNYAYYFTESNYVGRFSGQNTIICDEADTLESELLGFIRLTMSEYALSKYFIGLPKGKSPKKSERILSNWKSWAIDSLSKLETEENKLQGKLEAAEVRGNIADEILLRQYNSLGNMMKRFELFIKHVDSSWLLDIQEYRGKKTYHFMPTWLTPELTKAFFFRHGKRFIMMSATLLAKPVMCKVLGLDPAETEYIDIPSVFPVKNRPIHVNPVANMAGKTIEADTPKLVKEVERILALHPLEKGLIHTYNYKIAKAVMEIKSDRLITHDGSDKVAKIELFKTSSKPLVMVSPSMDRGVSLNDDLARFIIICKCPYLYLGDKQVSSRTHSGRFGSLWYSNIAIQTIEQMAGRGTRHKEDKCAIYILDAQVDKLLGERTSFFSEYFKDCVVF